MFIVYIRVVIRCLYLLQVVLNKTETAEDGQIIAANLMKEFGVNKEHLISCAYIDLLLNKINN